MNGTQNASSDDRTRGQESTPDRSQAQDHKETQQRRGANRRQVLSLLGATTAASLAGCSGLLGDDSEGDGDLGERVPPLVLEYWTGLGGDSKIFEDTSPVVQEAAEALGMELEIAPTQFTEQIGHVANDERTHDISYWSFGFAPDRLDPDEWCRRFSTTWAGADGDHNPSNWANCEYTEPALAQASAQTESERQELVNESQEILTSEYAAIPVAGQVSFTAYRTDEVEIGGAGTAGINRQNPYVYVESTPKNGDSFTAFTSPEMLETTNFGVIESSTSQGVWNKLVHSTLTQYDSNLELTNVLADEWEASNGGRTITVTLKDATFHNGDPVTAEDVQFTFEQLVRHPGTYTQASNPPYDSIDVVDDKTVEFNLEEPFLPLVSRVWPRWGIFHKETWVDGGAVENPEEFSMDPVIGSGPFEINQLESGSFMELVPHDGHPTMSPDHNVVFRVYREPQAMFQGFQANEVQMIAELSPGLFERVQEMDNAEAVSTTKHTPFGLYPQTPKAPLKFKELRQALGMALNRQKINNLGFLGETEPEYAGTLFTNVHPWRPPDDRLTKFTEEPEGEPEAARQLLEDAGYGYDGDGNLHYPPDADLTPLWPAEELPPEEDFPCLSESEE